MKKSYYAIVWNNQIEWADFFRYTGCHCKSETQALAVYKFRKDAMEALKELGNNHTKHKIIKLQIKIT